MQLVTLERIEADQRAAFEAGWHRALERVDAQDGPGITLPTLAARELELHDYRRAGV